MNDAGQPRAEPLEEEAGGFEEAQRQALIAIGQALIGQSTPGTASVELTVKQSAAGQSVDLDFSVNLERPSGLALPAEASDDVVEAVQTLVLLWREHQREPFRVFHYRLTRGESGPVFTSSFDY